MPETFQTKVCRHFDLPAERYGEWMLRQTLYPHAGWLRLFPAHDWLAPDRDFIEEAGWQTQWSGFHRAARSYQYHPGNRTFARRHLRLRVSVSRMRDLFTEVSGERVAAAADGEAALIGRSRATHG